MDLVRDISSSTGVGGACASTTVEHVRTFAGHDNGDDSDPEQNDFLWTDDSSDPDSDDE